MLQNSLKTTSNWNPAKQNNENTAWPRGVHPRNVCLVYIQKSIADVHHIKENKGEKTHACINQCRKALNGI